MFHDQTVESLTQFLRQSTHYDGLTPETDLIETGLLTSLTVMDLVTFIDRDLNVSLGISDLTPSNLQSIETIAQTITNRLAMPE